jgi:hypothetical protein
VLRSRAAFVAYLRVVVGGIVAVEWCARRSTLWRGRRGELVEPREKNQLPARTAGRVPTAQRRDADRSPRARPPLSSRRVEHGVVRARRVRVRVLFAARVAAAVLAPTRADARAPSPNASAFDEREG